MAGDHVLRDIAPGAISLALPDYRFLGLKQRKIVPDLPFLLFGPRPPGVGPQVEGHS
jgi:hypothetical protein